ncbi:MAG TPA: VWA domain-containing protein [Vicinamibacterales bacterium]|nr:VWA domain-containing protein [Vicinamibacterales bacterium]
MTKPRGSRLVAALLAAAAASVALAAAQGQAPPPQRQPVFRGGANFVLVDAYPQRDGKIVEGLKPADFEVLEDGKAQIVDSLEFVRIDPGPVTSERRDPNNTREMLQVAADPHNRVFVVFLDGLHTTVDGSHNIRGPLVSALNRIIAPNDLFGVTTHLQRPRDLVLGRRLETVEAQLTRYWTWGQRQSTLNDPADPAEDSLKRCFEYTPGPRPERWLVDDGAVRRDLYKVLIERRREDRVLTSLGDMLEYLAAIREARTTLLLISDGWLLLKENRALAAEGALIGGALPGIYQGPGGRPTLTPPLEQQADYSQCLNELNRLASLDNERRFRDMLRAANRANVAFYPIAASGLTAFDTTLAEETIPNPRAEPGVTTLGREFDRVRDRVQNLRTLAENTDGIAVVSTNDIAGGLKRVIDDLSAYYLLGYYSTNTKFDGKLRRIEVKVKQPDVRVRARRGYVAPTEAMLSAPVSATPAAPAAASDAVPVDEALGVLARLRPGADLYVHGIAHAGELQIAVELSSRAIELAGWAQGGAVRVEAGGSGATRLTASGTIEPGARGAVIRVPGAGTDGPWQIAVRVTGSGDPLDERFEIRAPASKLLGGALLYRGTPSPRSPLRAVADFQFRRTERAHLEWPILEPLDNRTARLLDRKGLPLPIPVNLTERPGERFATLLADIQLAPLTDGEYVVEIIASRGGVNEHALVPIRVVR